MFLRTPSQFEYRADYHAAVDVIRRTLTKSELDYARTLFAIERFGKATTTADIPALYIILVYNMKQFVRGGGVIKHEEFQHDRE